MVILIVLLCLLLIGMIPLGICVRFSQQQAAAWLVAGPFRFRVYPRSKAKNKRKTTGKATKKDGFESHAKSNKKNNKLTNLLPIVQLIFDFLTDFRSRLRINDLQLKVILAGDDPCDLSINYGRAWAALGNLMPYLERYFVIKKRNLEIECDYASDAIRLSGYLNMTISVGHVFAIGAYHGIKILRKYIQITKNAKDGATL